MRTRKVSILAVALAAAMIPAVAHAEPSTPPRLDRPMPWFRWQPASDAYSAQFSTGQPAVVGLETMTDLPSLRRRYGFTVIRDFPALRAVEIRLTRALRSGAPTDARIRYLSPATATAAIGSGTSLLAAPHAPLVTTIDPSTSLPYEWQFGAANMAAALELSPGSPSFLVGTIDSGAADIPDLAGKIESRWLVSPLGELRRDDRATDYIGHGTAVASLIAGNGHGMLGFGGEAHVISVRAERFTPVAIAVALMTLDSLGVRIVNMSFGATAEELPIVVDAVHKAETDGLLLIAAAGNSNDAVAHPAADLQQPNGQESYGLAVGASDVTGSRAFFSNSGTNLSLLAPGAYGGACSGVLVAAPISDSFVGACYPSWTTPAGGSYAYVAGTSFAAPEAAGVAALIWAARPALRNYQVADIIKESARRAEGWTPASGCGTLDAGAALELALSRSADDWAHAAPTSPCSAG